MGYYIGIDESGKGDFFGPLVIGGVVSNEKINQVLIDLGVKDSKRLSDGRVSLLAEEIKKICLHEVVLIKPKRYNELIKSLNLNKLLAWGHARVAENLLKNVKAKSLKPSVIISDQFGDEKYLLEALMQEGRKIKVLQRHKAEVDPAVAAASVIARAEFLKQLKILSEKYEMDFPKGAGQGVIEFAREFVKKYGRDELVNVAKIHFKTSRLI